MQSLTIEGLEACPLEESAALLKFTLRAANAGSWAWDIVTGEVFWSEEFHQLAGTSPATCQPSYTAWLNTIHPQDRQNAVQETQVALAERRELNNEFRMIRPDGAVRWMRSQGRALYDLGGKPLRMVGVMFDITKNKLAEEELRRREEELRIITNGVPALISYVDTEQRYRFANAMYEEWFGHSSEEISGKHVREVLGDVAYEELRPHMESALAGRETRFETWIQYQGAGLRCVEARYVPRTDDQGVVQGFFALVTDVTERKRDEERHRLQAEELTTLMDATPAAVWVTYDPDCRTISGSRAGHELLRMPVGANLSKTAGEEDPVPHFKVLKDGVELAPDELPMQRAAHGAEVRDFEEEVVFDDGSRLHLFGNAMPLHDSEGKVRGAIGAFVDITQRKLAEEALQESDRRKDDFLAMLAHELRNPLAPIRNAVQVMRHLGSQDPRLQEMRDVVDRQTDQLAHIIDDLLDISRIGLGKVVLRKEKADLLTIIGRAVETSRPFIDARGHRLTVSLPPESLPVEGDVIRLTQVVSNLLHNAAKYTETGGDIRVTAEGRGPEVQIRVKDNGIGIPTEALPHVFDLFNQSEHTLGRSEGGLGIGLTLVKNIVEMHGGTVRALSAGLGQGTEIVISLPAGTAPPHPALAETGNLAVEGDAFSNGRRILMVDDDVDTAESMALLLELGGHDVRTAYDGPIAIETAKAFQPHVVLLDIGLPKMSGYEVAQHLRQQQETRLALLIALSGYGQEEDRQRALDSGFDHYLIKPIDHGTLETLINSGRPA